MEGKREDNKGSPGRKRKAAGSDLEEQSQARQPPQQQPRPPGFHPLYGSMAALPPSFTLDPSLAQAFQIVPSVAAAAAASAASASSRQGSVQPTGLYEGNIAAACEAANQEAAQKQNESPQEQEDENIRRKKAASRITAWQSRERKRIEMEVLQERKADLTQRNSDIRSENEHLRMLIARLKTVIANPSAPRTSQQQGETLSESLSSALAAQPFGPTATQSSLLGLDALTRQAAAQSASSSSSTPFRGYDISSGHLLNESALVAAALGLQPLTSLTSQNPNPFAFGLSGNTMLNPNQQIQQRPDGQGSNFPPNIYSSQVPLSRALLGLQDMIAPLTRQQASLPGHQLAGISQAQQLIVPTERQEDIRGVPPLSISSVAAPAGGESKLSETEDKKRSSEPEDPKGVDQP
ncbi:MAG: hypothetical protein SGILL_005840 [Bacillariaceae sp.]